MTPYMAMTKMLASLISYNTGRRQKRGVRSNNTSSDFALEVFFSIVYEYGSYMYFKGIRCVRIATYLRLSTSSLGQILKRFGLNVLYTCMISH